MVNTEIRLIIFYQPEVKKLYTDRKNKTSGPKRVAYGKFWEKAMAIHSITLAWKIP